MPIHRVAASDLIHAPAALLYSIIADYRDGHPHILPKPPFGSLTVEEGGIGSGTRIAFEMRIMGRLRTHHAAITEPQTGQVLVETDLTSGAITTFTVEPRGEGDGTMATITTDIAVHHGLFGTLEAWLTTRILRPIYQKELKQLAAVAAARAS